MPEGSCCPCQAGLQAGSAGGLGSGRGPCCRELQGIAAGDETQARTACQQGQGHSALSSGPDSLHSRATQSPLGHPRDLDSCSPVCLASQHLPSKLAS